MTDKTNDKSAYLMTKEASESYVSKMLQLGTREELRAFVPATPLKDHLMFCIDRIDSQDGKRTYEFLVEYHTKNPSVGIYYGCRGVTKEGYRHASQIEQFRRDWEMVKPVVTQQLDNNLPGFDAERRYKMTDNANDNTYWLFWITLSEEEDIRETALRATTVIRNVFREYLSNPEGFLGKRKMAEASIARKKQRQREQECCVVPFTREAYDMFVNSQPEEFKGFIGKALAKGWLVENKDYGQYALQFMGSEEHNGNVDFAVMTHTFYKDVLRIERIPWVQIQQVFVDNYGTHYENIKGQIVQAQMDTLQFWKKAIESLYV